MSQILALYLTLFVIKTIIEMVLDLLNHNYYENPAHQNQACEKLGISSSEFQKTLSYTRDKYKFGLLSGLFNKVILISFILLSGFTWMESLALEWSSQIGWQSLGTGVIFFGIFLILSMLLSLPFEYYSTFVIEEKHGFNKQKIKGFISDKIKGLILSVVLGGLLITGILWAMSLGPYWWAWAWAVMTTFSLMTAWIYPSVLAPLFNKFNPLEEGELKKEIFSLSEKVEFKTSGIFIMDASTRSTHGNAYFTGLFGEKRIVLFDTLVKSLNPKEIVAVLAHELGHFKLHHVRISLIRSTFLTGFMFYLISLLLPVESFYHAFGFSGISNYAALVIFSLCFSLTDLLTTPLSTYLSRRNEFAADHFAVNHIEDPYHLSGALKKLSETNRSMPLTHPLYSKFYYSHPPLLERISVIEKAKN